MKRSIRAALAVGGVVLTMGMSACASIETSPDQVAIRYTGGSLLPEAEKFSNCQLPGEQHYGSPGDKTEYIYPVGQRTLKFSNDPGSDAPPLQVSAPSPGGGQSITMSVSGLVTFTPNFINADGTINCDNLRRFHEQIGRKYAAWTPEGWAKMISVYIKDPTDRASDNASLGYDWVNLTSNQDTKNKWEKSIADQLTGYVDPTTNQPVTGIVERVAGGPFFKINTVLMQKPDLPQGVQDAIADTEKARQQALTADQFAQAAKTFPGGPAAYQEFQRQQAINKAIEKGDVKVIPIPQGSPVIVQGG